MVQAISTNPILTILPESDALRLPQNPWYLSLPTQTLDSQASKFGYRVEVTNWWWQAWRGHLFSYLALLIILIGGWNWFGCREKIRQQGLLEDAACIEWQQRQDEQEKNAQLENERLEKLAQEKAIKARQNFETEKLDQQYADEIAEKLAAEKADADAKLVAERDEAARLLASIFNSKGHVRR